MKKIILDFCINIVTKYCNYNKTKLLEIRYGLETLYVTITKTFVIFLIAYFLNIIKELLMLLTFYSILRFIAHGLHAHKSYQCWISSILIFVLTPYLIKIVEFNLYAKIIISIITLTLIIIYAPADTEKKPIINSKKRKNLKIISSCIAITYITIIFLNDNILIVNSIIFSLIIETILLLPISYIILDLKYQNYKNYKIDT